MTPYVSPIQAWKYNKKDFFVMFMTMSITFITDTAVGVASGVGASIAIYLADVAFSAYTAPYVHFVNESGVEEVQMQGDLSFIQVRLGPPGMPSSPSQTSVPTLSHTTSILHPPRTQAGRFTYFVDGLLRKAPAKPADNAHPQVKARYEATTFFDSIFRPPALGGAVRDTLPAAIVFDFSGVTILDLTGQNAIKEAVYDARKQGVPIVITKTRPHVTYDLIKRGIYNDASTPEVNLDDFLVSPHRNHVVVSIFFSIFRRTNPLSHIHSPPPCLFSDRLQYYSDLPTKNRNGTPYEVPNRAQTLPPMYGRDEVRSQCESTRLDAPASADIQAPQCLLPFLLGGETLDAPAAGVPGVGQVGAQAAHRPPAAAGPDPHAHGGGLRAVLDDVQVCVNIVPFRGRTRHVEGLIRLAGAQRVRSRQNQLCPDGKRNQQF